MKPYSETKTVPANAIDTNGHVNNVTYLEWCIELAERHWFREAPKEVTEKFFWVVLEHHIAYHHPSFEGEELLLTTWVTTVEGVKSERHYSIVRKEDQKTLITAHTLWCYVALDSQRPARIPEEIRTLFL